LAHLAEQSGLSTQLISQALNTQQQMNFNDFLNQFRLTHIKAQLADPANSKADIQQLSLQNGFNSKATFYRVFKDKVGMTPSEFRKTFAAS
jgi:AraC-like DNA-binding protein